jgi:hypothetical protein
MRQNHRCHGWATHYDDTPCNSKTEGEAAIGILVCLVQPLQGRLVVIEKVNARLGRHFVLIAAKRGLSA